MTAVPPPSPAASLVCAGAMAVITWILAHATPREFAVLGATFAAATLLYGLRRLARP